MCFELSGVYNAGMSSLIVFFSIFLDLFQSSFFIFRAINQGVKIGDGWNWIGEFSKVNLGYLKCWQADPNSIEIPWNVSVLDVL